MWADAQRDGRPDEYRWCPLFNAAKFGWRPLPIMFVNRRNSRVIQKIWVEEHDGDVRCQTRSRKKAVSHVLIDK